MKLLEIEQSLNSELAIYQPGELPSAKGGAVNWAFLTHVLELGDLEMINPRFARWARKANARKGFLFREAMNQLRLKILGTARVRVGRRTSHGVFIFNPWTSEDFKEALDGNDQLRQEILASTLEAAKVAYNVGARFIGLGAMNSIITRNGEWLSNHTQNMLPVSSGGDGTAVGVKLGTLEAAAALGLNLKKSHLVLVGATGSVGRPTSFLLAPLFGKVTLVARNQARLTKLHNQLVSIAKIPSHRLHMTTNLNQAIAQGDVVILATNAADAKELQLQPEAPLPGALFVDVGRPRNLSPELVRERDDILCIEGAIFQFPGRVDSFYKFLQMGGPDRAFGCLVQTMDAALRGAIESESIGPELSVTAIQALERSMMRHRFRIKGFRMFDRSIEMPDFARVKTARLRREGRRRAKIRFPSLVPSPQPI